MVKKKKVSKPKKEKPQKENFFLEEANEIENDLLEKGRVKVNKDIKEIW